MCHAPMGSFLQFCLLDNDSVLVIEQIFVRGDFCSLYLDKAALCQRESVDYRVTKNLTVREIQTCVFVLLNHRDRFKGQFGPHSYYV